MRGDWNRYRLASQTGNRHLQIAGGNREMPRQRGVVAFQLGVLSRTSFKYLFETGKRMERRFGRHDTTLSKACASTLWRGPPTGTAETSTARNGNLHFGRAHYVIVEQLVAGLARGAA